MRYNILKATAPAMPNLGKGTECIKLLLSQASKDMHEALVPMFFPALGAHVSGSEFMYPDNSWKELCGQMANLVAESGGNKGQLSHLVEAICRDFRLHDDAELKKLVEWQQLVKTPGCGFLVPTIGCHQSCLHPKCHGTGEAGWSHAVHQHAGGGDGRPHVWRTQAGKSDDTQHL